MKVLFLIISREKNQMAELLLGAAALYLGYKGARRVRNAYTSAKSEMYAEQDLMNSYYQPSYPYSHGHSGRSYGGGGYYPSSGYGGRSGYAYGYH